MNNLITKMEIVPTKEAIKAGSIAIPESFRLSVLNWKETKTTKARASEAYIIPILYAAKDDSKQEAMFADLIADEQDQCLRLYATGELSVVPMIVGFAELAEYYFKDGRGNRDGLKQSVLIDYVESTLAEYMSERIKRNMPNKTDAERNGFVASLVRLFKIAATRSNVTTEKGTKVWCNLQALNDLAGRLKTYSYVSDEATDEQKAQALPVSEEYTALVNRINEHIKTESNSANVTVDQF